LLAEEGSDPTATIARRKAKACQTSVFADQPEITLHNRDKIHRRTVGRVNTECAFLFCNRVFDPENFRFSCAIGLQSEHFFGYSTADKAGKRLRTQVLESLGEQFAA